MENIQSQDPQIDNLKRLTGLGTTHAQFQWNTTKSFITMRPDHKTVSIFSLHKALPA